MMEETVYVAVDIGATGIKMVAASFADGRLTVKDTYSAGNRPLKKDGGEYADISYMLETIKQGLRRFGKLATCVSLGIDTYGNGYGILDADGRLIELPHHYRDCRVDHIKESVNQYFTDWELYQQTGNFPIKTRALFHLYQDVLEQSKAITRGICFLPLSNLLEYLLTGEKAAERTIASVLYFLDSKGEYWNFPVFEKLGIPEKLFGPLSEAGTIRGTIRNCFSTEASIQGISVAAVVGHDTESALLAAPMLTEDKVFVSLGTSLVFGARVKVPIINEKTYQYRFKNMRGAFGTYSLCMDFPGFWLLERCMERWRMDIPDLDYDMVCAAAGVTGHSKAILNVGDDRYRVSSDNLMQVIRGYCKETGQPILNSMGEICQCLFESYALYLKWNLQRLSEITGVNYNGMVAVNGGVRNEYLIQMIADALGIPVTTGSPVASAGGNLLMQLYAAGEASSEANLEEIARNSWKPKVYESRTSEYWDSRLEELKEKGIFKEEKHGQ